MLERIKINNDFINQVNNLCNEKDLIKLLEIINNLHHADVAEILEKTNIENAKFIYNNIQQGKNALVLIEIDNDLRKSILLSLSAKDIADKIIVHLESDDAVNIINELSNKKKYLVLSKIKNKDLAYDISDLLNYEQNTAGSLMAKELIKVNQNWNTLKCLKEMRKQADGIKQVHTIYVVNDNNKLIGLLSLRKLLLTSNDISIKEIVKKNIISVSAYERKENIANIMNKYDLVVIPVVDKHNKLIGRITIDDVLSVVKEEAEKDYQLASGISEDVEINDNILDITRARLPWLIIGMFGGILSAKIIGIFDLENNFELTFFIPLIAAMGGNVGIQSSAIVVQSIANRSFGNESILEKLFKELRVALLNGLICSLIILLSTYLLGYNPALSATVSISLLSVIIFAALFGAFIPLSLKKIKIDPALATGPFITTINDVLGLLIYFMFGQKIL
ncbi:MAG: magnesium transporter [Flavobacteriales bacterium]|nr:magnesium transporter [Flavobacteriales bacterium]|tara:strand:- start:14675 stop:16024 length:1350 start_codon:yes stop_codon:yes gene_type:complete